MATTMIYPVRYDLHPLILGFDWVFNFTYEVSGNGLDFTGYSMTLSVLESYDGPEVDSWTSSAGDITLGSDGSVSITIASTDQANLDVKTYKYIITMTSPGGITSAIMTGKFPVIDIDGA